MAHPVMNCLTSLNSLLLATALLLAVPTSARAAESIEQPTPTGQTDAYFAAEIWPGDGPVIRNGVLVVQDGRIVDIGQRGKVKLKGKINRHELGRAVLIPGLVAAETSLAARRADENAITPENLALDGFDFFGTYDDYLAGGVTTVQISPGTSRIMPGQSAVVKLGGESLEQRILKESEGLQIILSSAAFNPPAIYEPPVGAVSVDRPLEPTRPQLASSLGEAVTGLRAIFDAAEESNDADALAGDQPDSVDGAWLQLIQKWRTDKQPFRITANSAAEVRAAIRLAKQYQLPIVLVNPDPNEALRESLDSIDGQVLGIVLSTGDLAGRLVNRPLPGQNDLPSIEPWDQARQLFPKAANLTVAISPASDGDLSELLYLTSRFRKSGLKTKDVLSMVTSNAANLLGVADRVGVLSEGKDADFVVLNGPLFLPGSLVQTTYINGKSVWQRDQNDRTQIISNANIMQSDGTFEPGSIAIQGKTIRAVGSGLSVTLDAENRQWKNAYITPGFIDLDAQLGIGTELTDRISLKTKLGEELRIDDEQIAYARETGVTSGLLSSSQLPSPVLAFKFSDTPTVLADPVAIKFGVSGNLTSAESSLDRTLAGGKQYADTWTKYDAQMVEYEKQLKAYEAEKAKYEAGIKAAEEKRKAADKAAAEKAKKEGEKKDADKKQDSPDDKKSESGKSDKKPDADDAESKEAEKSAEKSKSADDSKSDDQDDKKPAAPKAPKKPDAPKKNDDLEPYRDLFARKIPAIVYIDQRKAIDVVVKLVRKKYNCELILIGGADTHLDRELLANEGVTVCIGPQLVGEIDDQRVNFPASLSVSGVPFCFQSKATTGVRDLPSVIGYAVHYGLGSTDALKALTSTPSSKLHLKTIGRLESGADADLVVFSGPPMDTASRVLAVMINGQWVFEGEQR